MTTNNIPGDRVSGETTITLADVRDLILDDPALSQDRRDKLASAIERMAEVLGPPVETLPAHPQFLRDLMANVIPLAVGLSEGRWRNLRADVQAALTHAGIVKIARRAALPLSPVWVALIARLPKYGDRYKLSRLASYCSAQNIDPNAVDDALMGRFLTDLKARSLVAKPERAHRDAITAWNRGVKAMPDWPQRILAVPDNTNRYAIPRERFPASFWADVDAWIDWLGGTDPKAERDFRPLRPRSLQLRRRQVHEFASALVIRGVDPALLTSLADLLVPDRAAEGFAFFYKRAGNKPSVHGGQIATTLCSIGRHWAKLGQDDLRRLNNLRRKITPKLAGMSERNRARLIEIDDHEMQKALVGLPYEIAEEVVKAGNPTRSLALQMETAVVMAVGFATWIRIGNTASLRLDRNLKRDRKGGVTLVLAPHEVKNRVAIESRLPVRTVALLDRYTRDYRPLLGEASSPWLFPGRTADAPKAIGPIRDRFQKCLRARLGLHFHPHLTRHANALMTLQRRPGAYGLVQSLLGHKSINTTIKAYTGQETRANAAFFHKEVLGLEADPATPPAGTGARKKKRVKATRKGRR